MSDTRQNQRGPSRDNLPIPNEAYAGPVLLRRQRPGGSLPADPGDPAACWRAERPGGPHRRHGIRGVERLRRADQHPDRGAAGGQRAQVHPLPHHRPLLAVAGGAADRAQPSLGRDGIDHRVGLGRARLHLDDPQYQGGRGQDAARQRLLHRPVRQVPRGAGLGDQPAWGRSTTGRRCRASRSSTASSAGRPTSGSPRSSTVSPGSRCRAIPPTTSPRTWPARRSTGSRRRRRSTRQALLHLLGARCHPCPAPGAAGVDREVPGRVRRRLGQTARADLCPPEGARRHSRRCRADPAAGADSRLGRHAGGVEAGPAPADGGLCRVP